MATIMDKVLKDAQSYGNKTASAAQNALSGVNNALAAANRAASAASGYGLLGSSYTTGGSTSTTTSTSKTTYDRYREYQRSQRVNEAEQALKKHLASQPGAYAESQAVADARSALDSWLAAKPGDYESRYQGQIDELLGQILDRPAFSYDFNQDAMYHMYRDRFEQQGQQAMRNTSAYNAAALTGGYGSSYAATAGAQAYQQNLAEVNEIIPQLYQMALDRYNSEGDTLRANLGALQSEEERAYGQYRDTVGDWQSQRDYLQGEYWQERSFDYGKYRDEVSDWQSMRDFLAEQYGEEYARDFEAWARDIEFGGTTTTNTSTTNTSSWSQTQNYGYPSTSNRSSSSSSSSRSGSSAASAADKSNPVTGGSLTGNWATPLERQEADDTYWAGRAAQLMREQGYSDEEIAKRLNGR